MTSTRASISKVSKRLKINIIPLKQLFMDLTQDDTKTSSPKLPNSSPSAPNAPSKTPSTKYTSSSSIDYIPKSPTSSTSPSPNDYLNPSASPPPRFSLPSPTQDNASMDITLTLSPNTPLDVQFDTPSPSPPIIAHPIPWNFLEAHGALILSDIASTFAMWSMTSPLSIPLKVLSRNIFKNSSPILNLAFKLALCVVLSERSSSEGREHRKQEIEYEKSRLLLYQVIDTPFSINLNTPYGSSKGQYIVLSLQNTPYRLEEQDTLFGLEKINTPVSGSKYDMSYLTW
ncbi:hypothetical protein Tco_1549656 [Tanacetum coccineum]